MVGRWGYRPGIANDLQLGMRRICTKPLAFRLQEGVEPRLADSGKNDWGGIRRSFLSDSEDDLIAKIAAEILDLVENVFQLRAISLLLLLPPIAQSGALLQPVAEEPVGLADRVGQVRDRGIHDRVVGYEWQKV